MEQKVKEYYDKRQEEKARRAAEKGLPLGLSWKQTSSAVQQEHAFKQTRYGQENLPCVLCPSWMWILLTTAPVDGTLEDEDFRWEGENENIYKHKNTNSSKLPVYLIF